MCKQVGPLFACIIKRQFENLRDGDRFFFSHRRSQEHPRPQGLPDVAKKNIKRRSLGAILCDNLEATVLASKITKPIGQNVFRTVANGKNPQLDCKSLTLLNSKLNLSEIFNEAARDLLSIQGPQGKIEPKVGFMTSTIYPKTNLDVSKSISIKK